MGIQDRKSKDRNQSRDRKWKANKVKGLGFGHRRVRGGGDDGDRLHQPLEF